MKYIIGVKETDHGFTVQVNKRNYSVNYPQEIWQSFPKDLHLPFAEFIAYMTTVRYAFSPKNFVTYMFPCPWGEAFFAYGLLMAAPENLFDFKRKNIKTTDFLKPIFNSFYRMEFTGHAREYPNITYKHMGNKAILPFSFGKDSLLTYALCKQLHITPIPIYFVDPIRIYENGHKLRMIKEFNAEFAETIQTFPLPLTDLRQMGGAWWGWDIFLTQYTFFLVPYMHYYKARYFFWSNEFNRNDIDLDAEGFLVNQTFDQSARWMQSLDTALRIFGCSAKLGSLLETLSELAVLDLLHRRFADIGKYQTSCFNEKSTSKTQRWCGKCDECAKVFLYLTALRINPARVDFKDNMLKKRGASLFDLFPKQNRAASFWLNKFDFVHKEKLYAFFLAEKFGVKGYFISQFKKRFLPIIEKQRRQLEADYFSLHSARTVPEELTKRIQKICSGELEKFRRTL